MMEEDDDIFDLASTHEALDDEDDIFDLGQTVLSSDTGDFDALTLDDDDIPGVSIVVKTGMMHAQATKSGLTSFKTDISSAQKGRLPTLADFTSLLASHGVEGPRHLRYLNIRDSCLEIGQGSQFSVFQEYSGRLFGDVVIKRVNFDAVDVAQQPDLAQNSEYRNHLQTLYLEVVSLCNSDIRQHRNIVDLIGWGYDYDDRITPVPILFMESAYMPLTEFLLTRFEHNVPEWSIKYHMSLDIAAGLEILHSFNIVHGDVKPDNVLVFRTEDGLVPFVAKLSDFGVCIDMANSSTAITPNIYTGTPAWVGPEVVAEGTEYDSVKFGEFVPEHLKMFDSYSYGLSLLAIFLGQGKPPCEFMPEIDMNTITAATETMKNYKGCPSPLKIQISKALESLLAEKPGDRCLPSASLLATPTSVYKSWIAASTKQRLLAHTKSGRKDTSFNQGHNFWCALEQDTLDTLHEQHRASLKTNSVKKYDLDTLFGLFLRFAKDWRPEFRENCLGYLSEAAVRGHAAARAIFHQIYRANDRQSERLNEKELEWQVQAIQEGFLFSPEGVVPVEQAREVKAKFRDNGGYCQDPFLSSMTTCSIARDISLLKSWIDEKGPHAVEDTIDNRGNRMIHVAATIGTVEAIDHLFQLQPNMEIPNFFGETPLYKAFQAGNAPVVIRLLECGHKPDTQAEPANLTPLHWLFNIPEESMTAVKEALELSRAKGSSMSPVITPVEITKGSPHPILMQHYPFEWPFGTPLHWAVFARNSSAINALIDLGAMMDATYHGWDLASTPLAIAVHQHDDKMAKLLVERGANPLSKDAKGRSLLHLMSLRTNGLFGALDVRIHDWVLHGSFNADVESAKNIVNILVASGAELECQTTIYPYGTPLVSACERGFLNGPSICALLEAGADSEVKSSALLLGWAEVDGRFMSFTNTYSKTMAMIISKVPDINVTSQYEKQTAFHLTCSCGFSINQFSENLSLLSQGDGKASLDVPDVHAHSPLMALMRRNTTYEDLKTRGQILLQHGVSVEWANSDGNNVFSAIGCNRWLMDHETVQLMEIYLSLVPEEKRGEFIESTATGVLLEACSDGKPQTVQYLLDLGFIKRINTPATCSRFSRRKAWQTALDATVRAAEGTRRIYCKRASYLRRGDELNTALKSDHLIYAPVPAPPGQESPARLKEAYWAYPKLIRLLQSAGAKQTHEIDPDWDVSKVDLDLQPSFEDAIALPIYCFTRQTQPHAAHWQIMYEVEVLSPGWEDEARAQVLDQFSDTALFTPTLMMIDRWPELLSVVEYEDGWTKAVLTDGTMVKILVEDGKVVKMKHHLGHDLNLSLR